MTATACPTCGGRPPEAARFCPYCGSAVTGPPATTPAVHHFPPRVLARWTPALERAQGRFYALHEAVRLWIEHWRLARELRGRVAQLGEAVLEDDDELAAALKAEALRLRGELARTHRPEHRERLAAQPTRVLPRQ